MQLAWIEEVLAMTDDGTGGLFVNPSGPLTFLDAVILWMSRSCFVMAQDIPQTYLQTGIWKHIIHIAILCDIDMSSSYRTGLYLACAIAYNCSVQLADAWGCCMRW